MKLSGVEIKNFRSIGEKGITINPFYKCNVLVGQNNAGKSNVIKAIKLISTFFSLAKGLPKLEQLDLHQRNEKIPFIFTLFFQAEKNDSNDSSLIKICNADSFWINFEWMLNGSPKIKDHSFATITDFVISNNVLNFFTGFSWAGRLAPEQIRNHFLRDDFTGKLWNKFKSYIPTVNIIPEFRQIRSGQNLTFDGENLIETLAHYQSPDIGNDKDQQKFLQIQKFIFDFLRLPKAKLEISRKTFTLIINNEIRLPLSSFGTGVHELLILLTSITSMNNSICCIEEPEIHFHPRLQKEFLHFMLSETSNIFLISTHSPSFINALNNNDDLQLIHLKSIDGTTEQISILKRSDAWTLLNDLGINPNDLLQSNCVLWVEGPSDSIYIRRWIQLLEPSLVEGRDYSFFCYSRLLSLNIDGENENALYTNVLSINRNSIIILDSDRVTKESTLKKEKESLINRCKENDVMYWLTDGKEIENYLSSSVIQKSIKKIKNVDISVNVNLFDDFGETLDRALVAQKERAINYTNNKHGLSKLFAQLFDKEDFDVTLREKVLEVIEKIKSFNSL